MNSNPTATLWLFGYGGITTGTHICVVRECLAWPNLDHWVMGNSDALISRTRSRFASVFVNAPRDKAGDVLLMVDHDIQWQPGDLSYIARKSLERNAIVGGIYPKREFGQGPALRLSPDVSGEWRIGEDRLIPAVYVASGFMAIPRTALEAVVEQLPLLDEGYWPLFMPFTLKREADGKWEYLSEDFALCERAKAAGFAIYAACLPRLRHEGNYTYRLIDAVSRPHPDEDIKIKLTSSVPAIAGDRS